MCFMENIQRSQPVCCVCKERESVLGQRMCRPCKAEYARNWRREVGSRAAYERGILEASDLLVRKGMGQAAELIRSELTRRAA